MNFDPILTPKSSNSFQNIFMFSPFSCGLQLKQDIENLFDSKGQEVNNEENQIKEFDISPLNNLEFPSPTSLGQKILVNNNFIVKNIPQLELPLNIQKKLEEPLKKKKKEECKKENKKEIKSDLKKEKVEIKKEVKEEIFDEEIKINKNRGWFVVYSQTNDFTVIPYTKTRCDKPAEEVEEILYSSLKYEIKQKLIGNLNFPFLLSKIYVVESNTGEIVQKNNKSVLKGQVEVAITNSSDKDSEISGILKVQFTDVSYHHKKCDFCWEIAYFTPNELNEPILKIRSSSFKVFARKPSQVVSTKKKRKRDDQFDFDNFLQKFEDLVQYTKKLKMEDKKNAISLVTSKLLEFESLLK